MYKLHITTQNSKDWKAIRSVEKKITDVLFLFFFFLFFSSLFLHFFLLSSPPPFFIFFFFFFLGGNLKASPNSNVFSYIWCWSSFTDLFDFCNRCVIRQTSPTTERLSASVRSCLAAPCPTITKTVISSYTEHTAGRTPRGWRQTLVTVVHVAKTCRPLTRTMSIRRTYNYDV